MKKVLFLLLPLCFYAKDLSSFDCETQNFDFQVEAIRKLQDSSASRDKILFASYYKSYQKRCKLDVKDWCREYSKVKEADYFIYKNLMEFKCNN